MLYGSIFNVHIYYIWQDGLKPIEIAALRGNRDAIEVLLPLTSPIPKISNWSIDGVIEFMQSDANSQQVYELEKS